MPSHKCANRQECGLPVSMHEQATMSVLSWGQGADLRGHGQSGLSQ